MVFARGDVSGHDDQTLGKGHGMKTYGTSQNIEKKYANTKQNIMLQRAILQSFPGMGTEILETRITGLYLKNGPLQRWRHSRPL